jgi:vacuolar-type H+-ATPase subunit H
VNDNRIKDRVNGLTAGGPPADQPRPVEHPEMPGEDDGQLRSLVLTLAEHTAQEHIADARQQADTIHAQAQTTAEQVVRDAQARAAALVREAEEARTQARVTVEQVVRDAQAQADHARRNADTMVSEARARAEQITADAQARAEELDDRAKLRQKDFVGSMAVTQQAVQQQIQVLEDFDRDYRTRLASFVQAQLNALADDGEYVDAGSSSGPGGPEPMPTTTTAEPKATTEDTAGHSSRTR